MQQPTTLVELFGAVIRRRLAFKIITSLQLPHKQDNFVNQIMEIIQKKETFLLIIVIVLLKTILTVLHPNFSSMNKK